MMQAAARFQPLKVLLVVHGLITLAAGILLIFLPPAIPGVVNITVSHGQYLLCYLLGAAELSTAFLSLFSSQLRDRPSLRLISASFIVFHLATGLLEAVALASGGSQVLLLNILLRVLMSLLFGYFGIYRMAAKTSP